MFTGNEQDIGETLAVRGAELRPLPHPRSGHAQNRIIAREPAITAIVDALVGKIERREQAAWCARNSATSVLAPSPPSDQAPWQNLGAMSWSNRRSRGDFTKASASKVSTNDIRERYACAPARQPQSLRLPKRALYNWLAIVRHSDSPICPTHVKTTCLAGWHRAFAPVDIASLVFFSYRLRRFNDVACMAAFQQRLIAHLLVSSPDFFSSITDFPGSSPGQAMITSTLASLRFSHFSLPTVFSIARARHSSSSATFIPSFSMPPRFVNHTYLICLFQLLLVWVPANRAWSIDAWFNPKLRSQTIPAWSAWLLRAQMGVVHLFAGWPRLRPTGFKQCPCKCG